MCSSQAAEKQLTPATQSTLLRGTQINNTVAGGLTKMTEGTILKVLQEYKIHHCELLFREDCTVDQLIDALEGNRKYIRWGASSGDCFVFSWMSDLRVCSGFWDRDRNGSST